MSQALSLLPPVRRSLRLAGALCALLAVALPASAASWWNTEWTLRKQVTIDTTAAGAALAEDAGAQPVLVRLTDGNFQFTAAKPDGSDLRFVAADDKTPLPYHIEKFDGLLNEALVWVRVPAIKAGAKTTFWLYYGNAGNAPKAEDAKATYDESTVLVYHFNERGQPANDFTMGGNNAAAAGVPIEGALIGPGLRLDGRTPVAIPGAPALNWPAGATFTWSAWVKPAGPQPRAELFSRRSGNRRFAIELEAGVPRVELAAGGAPQRSAGGAPLTPGGWHHLAVTADGQQLTLYVDGAVYSSFGATVPALSDLAVIGGDPTGGTAFVGELDEMTLDRVARSAAAIKFAAASQGPDGTGRVVTFGEDQQDAGWFAFLKGGYVGVIIGSLTVDGWVVIGLLAVMSAVSWVVMIGKGAYVNRVGKANELFLANWRQVATDLSVLDSGDAEQARSLGGRSGGAAMHASPLYRIYHIGVEEIRHRLAGDAAGGRAKVLTARSIQAIRASLDGGLVRETQRLNGQMVLLTIAISGGPFLGLLGTVVGVMITFAAVAQAGDVNVNAIAPGIAAALAATVAGLAVAIPALFGYNYLLTQIKSASNDMHVFIDEFVTKLAEFYSDEVVVETSSSDGAH